jgi:hypothetical protein
MTDDRLNRIKAIQKQIVDALEEGEDVTRLRNELARVRADIAADAEVEELRKISNARQALRNKAEQIRGKIEKHTEAIDTHLKARDNVTEALLPIIGKAKELVDLHDKCFAEFHDPMQAGAIIRSAGGFLPADLTIPMLQLGNGQQYPYDASRQAFMYLNYAYGLLANQRKVETKPVQPPIDPDLDFGDNHSETTESRCMVCEHPKAEAINNALREGRSLRDIEAEFAVSRSTLSRHKNKCLNLAAITVVEDK